MTPDPVPPGQMSVFVYNLLNNLFPPAAFLQITIRISPALRPPLSMHGSPEPA